MSPNGTFTKPGVAAIEVLENEKLKSNSLLMGEYFKEKLLTLPREIISEVRGKGLLIAIEFSEGGGAAKKYVMAMKERGLLAKQTHETTIRFAPPLVITQEQVNEAFEIIKEAVDHVFANPDKYRQYEH